MVTEPHLEFMFDLTQFIHRCQAIVAGPDPVPQLRTALETALKNPQALRAALPDNGEDEVLLHACGKVTMVLVQLTPNVLFPPHNHYMPALIGLFSGVETNVSYQQQGERLAPVSARTFEAPAVNVMPATAIHAVANHGTQRSAALHVYCGDLISQSRSIWNPLTWERHPYSDATYFSLARPLDPDRPMVRPATPSVHGSYLDRS